MTVLGCIVYQHNIWLVIIAGLLCAAGAWVTTRLFVRSNHATGRQRAGWYFLTALTAGVAIWCTHFIAMLGFDAGMPVSFEPVLTVISLLIAVVGSTIGFVLGGSRLTRAAPLLGGAVIGLAIATMHYVGMIAYRVQGVVSWDMPHLISSVVLSVVFSSAALYFGMRKITQAHNLMAGQLSVAILTLHFTGMAAFRIEPFMIEGKFTNPAAFQGLAIAITGMSLVIIGAGLVSYLLDDQMRAEAVERLRAMALIDALTGLPNRANYNERLELELELARQRKGKLALIGIDLNRFKEINDLRGHNAGDEVLRVLGRRIKSVLRENEGEFVARTGGDEFCATCRINDRSDVSDFLERLERVLFKSIRFQEFDISPGASLGVSIYPDDAADIDTLIGNSDLAMYRAKGDPLRRICFYEPSMDEQVKARRGMAADLRQAIDRGELSLHYQVQTSVADGQICGYEALLRWQHPRYGSVPPADFIPLAEENGLILPIGEWVMRRACTEAASWNPPYKVAVNLSALQFVHADLPQVVMSILVETGLSPHRLELELTETAIFADRDRALHILRQLKGFGISIALDDFGTGYSSLDTLRAFPFDRIKIDRSFFDAAMITPQTMAVIRAVLALGRSFGIPVLAEGIETYDQLSMLNQEGCEEAQGFLLGRPVPVADIVASGQISQRPPEPYADYGVKPGKVKNNEENNPNKDIHSFVNRA